MTYKFSNEIAGTGDVLMTDGKGSLSWNRNAVKLLKILREQVINGNISEVTLFEVDEAIQELANELYDTKTE